MSRGFALSLIFILAVSSLLMVKPAFASIPKPSVPEFTVKFVDRSYDVPTTSSIDPYTGETISHPGYRVENYTVDVTIKNQPFVSYYDAPSSFNVSLYYNVRFKGHYSDEWMTAYSPYTDYPKQSSSTYTVLTFISESDNEYVLGGRMVQFPPEAQVDFQVQALIGYVHRVLQGQEAPWYFTGEESGWTNTQTITIGTSAPTATPSTPPSATPQETPVPTQSGPQTATVLGLGWGEFAIIVLLSVIAVLLVIAIVYLRKRSTKST